MGKEIKLKQKKQSEDEKIRIQQLKRVLEEKINLDKILKR